MTIIVLTATYDYRLAAAGGPAGGYVRAVFAARTVKGEE
jgi:hypothetical protein